MASFATLHSLNNYSLLRSQFLGQDHHHNHNLNHHHFPLKHTKNKPSFELQPHAKFNLFEIMGGRGICNGEKGIEIELERKVPSQNQQQEQEAKGEDSDKEEQENSSGGVDISEDAFEKEMMGLTGGFPGGEKGLQKFIEENPPYSKQGTVVTISERKEAKAKAIV